uniref:Uncharacterized protein n=1 Tax=Anguilla anguilla TaxID=7936 RepID=A0A0E9X304_ANGAN
MLSVLFSRVYSSVHIFFQVCLTPDGAVGSQVHHYKATSCHHGRIQTRGCGGVL